MTKRNTELLLLIVAAPIVIVMFAMMVLNGAGTIDGLHELSFNTLGIPIGIFVAFLLAHIAIRWLAPEADPALLPITFALSGIGIAFVTRLAPAAATRQLMWMFAGVVIMVLVLLAVRKLDKLAGYKYTLVIIGVILLLAPMLPGIGTEINGSRLWLKVGDLSFQPGEIAKICIVLFLGAYLAQNREMLSIFTWRLGPLRLPSLGTLLPLLFMWALAFLIVVLEKDLGSALVLFLVFIVMLYVATGKKSYVVIGLALAAIGATAIYFIQPHVQTRVDIWLDPFADAQGSGWQIVQGLYSLADGDLFGVGIGRGLAEMITYVESDFIFAAIGEETGLLGAAGLLLLYLLFAIRGVFAAARARSDFSSFVAIGLTSIIILQAFIIVGGVTRLIPLTGITLPFVSQGGSSLVAGFIIVALLLRVGDEATGCETEMTMTTASPRVAVGSHATGSHAPGAVASAGAAFAGAGVGASLGSYADDGTGVLGRVSLGKRLTNTMIAFSVLFALLVANLTYIMVIDAQNLRNMPGNNHTMMHESESERGTISTVDGVVLAQSVEQPDGTYKRVYPAGQLAAHVVGYYSTQYGASGIEADMNDTLRGSENYASWTDVVNSLAGISQPGNDITLTINSKVQQAAQDAIAGYKGACVVIDPTTGAVLAMASSPTYDADDVENVLKAAASGSASGDAAQLLNRATQGLYAPGSTFKMVTLAAALQNGVATEETQFASPSEMEIGNAPVTNFNSTDWGTISLRRALEVSSNTVFGQIGAALGADRLVAEANAFGFDKTFDFELPMAKSLMPDPDEMTLWETAWAAAGEPVGEHESPAGPQATVMEMALVGCAMAHDGTIMKPYLVEGVYNSNGSRGYAATPQSLWRATTPEVAGRVLDVMKGVVTSGSGTDAAISGVSVAGKTGTAEHEGKQDDSWFVGVADADGAKNVVCALMLEEVGRSAHAAGKARPVIEAALAVQN